MKKFNSLRDYIHYRITESEEKYYYVTLWEEEVKLFCEDLQASMQFVRTEATDEEMYWLTEIFEDILAETKSLEVLECLRERAERVVSPKKKEIKKFLEDAVETVDFNS